MNSEIQSQILAFIALLLPLVGALWKLFNLLKGIEDHLEKQIRELDRRLSDLSHQSQLRSFELEALNDKVVSAVHGTKELVDHLRERTKTESDSLAGRMSQAERFLTKIADYKNDLNRLSKVVYQIEQFLVKTTTYQSRE